MGAVLQAALARQHRHLPEGARDGGAGGQGQDGEKNSYQILPPVIYSVHKKIVSAPA